MSGRSSRLNRFAQGQTSSFGGSTRSRSRSMPAIINENGRSTSGFKRPRGQAKFRGRSLKSVVNYVRQNVPKAETKFKLGVTQQISHTTATGIPNIPPVLLNGLSTGDTVQTRDGNNICLRGGKLKGTILCLNGAGTVRVMVVLDKQNNKTALTNGMLFGTTTPSTHTFLDFAVTNTQSRFTVLAEKTYNQPTPFLAIQGGNYDLNTVSSLLVDLGWNCNDFVASYGANAGDATDISSGAVYLCVQQSTTMGSDSTGGLGGVFFVFDYTVVQYFKDM